jgi:gas vesicle protein
MLIMAQNIIRTGNYFLVGLGIGSLVGVLFAPKSGAETRSYIAKKTSEGNEVARKKVREIRDGTEDTVEHGKKIIVRTEGRIAAALELALEAYNRENSTVQVS